MLFFVLFGYVIDVIPLSLAEKETRRKYITRRKKERRKKKGSRGREEKIIEGTPTPRPPKLGRAAPNFSATCIFLFFFAQLYTFVAKWELFLFPWEGLLLLLLSTYHFPVRLIRRDRKILNLVMLIFLPNFFGKREKDFR